MEKRSRFLACGAPATPEDPPDMIVHELAGRFRMEKAGHLSWALRLRDGTERKGDGGESGAGNCILEAMRGRNAADCLILVARWYGGIHLGGLRFRIYRQAAGELLSSFGVQIRGED
jgi:putative IMPACT (imprinted ancient) family translation regulator